MIRSTVAPIGFRRAGLSFALVLAAGFAFTAGTARAEDSIEKRLWVQAGKGGTVTIDSFRELREDCTIAPAPSVTVVENPKAGKITVSTVSAASTQPLSGPYAACKVKKFNWAKVTMPVPAKEGTDHAVIQAQESTGDLTTYDVEIVAKKKLPAGKSHGLYEDR